MDKSHLVAFGQVECALRRPRAIHRTEAEPELWYSGRPLQLRIAKVERRSRAMVDSPLLAINRQIVAMHTVRHRQQFPQGCGYDSLSLFRHRERQTAFELVQLGLAQSIENSCRVPLGAFLRHVTGAKRLES